MARRWQSWRRSTDGIPPRCPCTALHTAMLAHTLPIPVEPPLGGSGASNRAGALLWINGCGVETIFKLSSLQVRLESNGEDAVAVNRLRRSACCDR